MAEPTSLQTADEATPRCGAREAQSGKRRARPWHRVLGLIAALPLVWVVITGALLNHTVDWKLDDILIENPMILSAYGMSPEGNPVGVMVEGHQVASWDGVIFYDAQPMSAVGELLGAVPDGDGVAIVTDEQVLRLDAEGGLVEYVGELSLPALPLEDMAYDRGSVWLRNATAWHQVSHDWLEFDAHDDVAFKGRPLSAIEGSEARSQLRRAWSGAGLPASRVLLDLHAARFLGPVSKYFYDFVAVCTIWLCVTGAILFFRKPRRGR